MNDNQLIWEAYESSPTHKKHFLDYTNQWDEFNKCKNVAEMWEKLSIEPTVENLAKLSLEKQGDALPKVFAHPDLWYDVQKIATNALKLVKSKSALEIYEIEKNPQTPEELFITYISPSYQNFQVGGKAELVRILNKIINEDRWEMLAQHRENVYVHKK